MNKSLDDLLYEHCEDLTDVQHIKFRTQLEAYIQVEKTKARIEELDNVLEYAKKQEYYHGETFAKYRIKQLNSKESE